MHKQKIIKATGIDEEQYAEYVWDLGIRYAYFYTNEDDEAVRWITQTSSYWEWYKNQWAIIDQVFEKLIDNLAYPNDVTKKGLKDLWLKKHSPEQMVAIPGKYVMDRAWEIMITAMNKELAPEINNLQSLKYVKK